LLDEPTAGMSSSETEVKLGLLVTRPLVPELRSQLSIVHPKERMHSRLIISFLSFAKARLAELSAQLCSGPATRGRRF
jgi:hypothetical protein